MLLISEAHDHDENSRISESCAPDLYPLALFRAGVVNAIHTTREQSCSCQNDQVIAWAVLRRQEGLLLRISEIR